jgi:4-hydroxy-tetrahydrodipicolinate reductase
MMERPAFRVAVVGARGRMGRFACQLLAGSDRFELAAEIERGDELGLVLAECGASLALDFTEAGLGARHGRIMLEAGVRPVIGTSGVSAEEVAELDRIARARAIGGLVVPNFSLGMLLLQRAAEAIAIHFADCEIIELHHKTKKDAPSATSLDTAARIERARARGGERGEHVPIHSVRLAGLLAHQEILFGAAGEALTLRHDVRSPEAFGPGILAALAHARGALGVASGLDRALAEKGI